MALLTPATVFRKYVTDGVADSGAHDPIKSEIVQLLNSLFGISRGGWVVAQTRADLLNVTPEAETDGGVVLNDATAAYNGYYARSAAAWVRGRGFPDTLALVTLSGSANTQIGAVATGVDPDTVLEFIATPSTPNTGPMTLDHGDGAKPVLNYAGNPLAAGEWATFVRYRDDGAGNYRLTIDANAAASAAQSASDAQQALDDALAMIVPDNSVSTIKIVDNAVTGAKIAGGAIDESHFSDTLAGALPTLVMSVSALRGVDGDRFNGALVLEHGKAGIFRRTNDDVSASLVDLTVTSTAVDSGTETITKTAHGLRTGDAVISTTAVNGLSVQTLYYVIASTADTFKLAATFLEARAGTPAINLTGTTNFTVKRLIDPRQGIYVISTGESLDGADGCWVREFSGRADVRWFGAVGNYSDDDTHALQATSDLCGGVYVPNGQFRTTKTWLLDNSTALHFESLDAIIRTPSNIDMIAGRGTKAYHHTGYRNYRLTIDGGQLNGPAQDNGQAALNFESFSLVDIFGTEIYGIQYGFRAGGDDSLGAFYINCFGVKISHVSTAVSNGTLANAILFSGGRANDILYWGTEDNDNTDVTYDGFKVEAYGVGAHRVSHTGQTSQRIRFVNGRNENLILSTASGISIYAGAQNTIVSGMISINAGTVDIEDAGTSTVIVAPYI